MAGINSLGVGSGLDLGNLVDQLVTIERQTAEGPLDRRQARTEVRLSSIGSLRSAVASLLATVSSLRDVDVGRSVASSFDAAVTGTATATADVGSYLIDVTQVAVAQSLASANDTPFTDLDASLGTGTLTVTTGGGTLNVALTPGQDSLRYVRDAINASSLGIHAALVREGDVYHLLLTSGQTGTAGEMTLTVDGTVDTRLASANMDVTAPAADAVYSVNGLSLTSSSNTIEGVLPGVTLELKAQTGGQSVALDVVADRKGLAEKLSAVVGAFNALTMTMAALGGAKADGSEAGPLVGDASLRALQRQVAAAFSTNQKTAVEGNPFANLVALGVHTDLAGTATLNESELAAALETNEGGVEALIGAFAEGLETTLKNFEGSRGILTHRTDQLNAELRRIGVQREELDRRLAGVEARLRARFGALDSLVAQFQSTSTFLAQQLEGLSALVRSRPRS